MSTTNYLKLNKHDNVATNENEFDIDNYLNVNWDKIDGEFNNINTNKLETDTKLQNLETDNTNNKNKITTLEKTTDYMQERLANSERKITYLESELSDGQAEGESITVNDSAEYDCSIGVSGNSRQASYSGKNYFGKITELNTTFNGITMVQDSVSGEITFNGTTTGTWNHTLVNNVGRLLSSLKNYTVSIKTSGTFTGGTFSIYSKYEDNTSVFDKSYANYPYTFAGQDKSILSYNLYINKGITFNNFTMQIQLEEGTTATDYEPYVGGTASPNPSYPQQIETVNTNANIVACNKNWFDGEKESGTILIETGVNGVNENNIRTKNHIPIAPNTQYTISSNIAKTRWFIFYKKDKTFLSNLGFENIVSQSFTTPQNAYYVRWYDVANTDLTTKWQLEKGSATDYIQHQEQTFTIPVQQEMLKIGDVKDGFEKVDGVWKERHSIGKVVLNGTENWNAFGAGNGYKLINSQIGGNDKTNIISNVLSDKLVAIKQDSSFTGNVNNSISTLGGIATAMYVKIDNTIDTVAKFKTWLSTNNVTVYYELATPTYLDCTAEQIAVLDQLEQAQSYYGQTNVFSTDELPPYIKLDYKKSNKLRIENLENAILSIGGGV